MVILVGLMFTANYSYSLYSQYWAGRLGSFDRTVFYFQGLLQVKETIDSSIPYIVKKKNGHTFYFLGREEGFTLISASPIFAPTVNDAAVVRVFREKTDDGYQLVYEEAPLANKLLTKLDQIVDFKYRTVLMRTEHPIAFEYYGWMKREHKFERSVYLNEAPKWSVTYDGAVTRIQPQRIRMKLGGNDFEYDLPVGHDKLINFYIEDEG
jgi:hypothetical protein